MQIHELTPEECREILARTTMARLGCSRANQPYIIPVNLTYHADSDVLFGVSPIGKKITWMRRNPRVCVELEDVEDRFHWTTVIVNGRYDEIPPSVEQREARQQALDMFKSRAEWWLPALGKVKGREPHSLVVYRILIDQVTGRRADRRRS